MRMETSCGIIPLLKTEQGLLVLLLQHTAGHRWFPKWHTEKGETEIETARREFIEETWLTHVQIDDGQSFRDEYTFVDREQNVKRKQVMYFVWRLSAPLPLVHIQESEILDYRFCSKQEALGLLKYDGVKNILEHVM